MKPLRITDIVPEESALFAMGGNAFRELREEGAPIEEVLRPRPRGDDENNIFVVYEVDPGRIYLVVNFQNKVAVESVFIDHDTALRIFDQDQDRVTGGYWLTWLPCHDAIRAAHKSEFHLALTGLEPEPAPEFHPEIIVKEAGLVEEVSEEVPF